MTDPLDEVAALIHAESGIRIAPAQYPFLRAGLGRIGPDRDPVAFLRRASAPSKRAPLVAKLIDEVTVKETSFLRERRQLERIDWKLLLRDARAAGAKRLRVWSAPCATGEEAYSLALLACEAFGPSEPPVTILGTDISGAAIARARAGVYRSRAAREIEPGLQRRYFHRNGEQLTVGERLRPLVRFAKHNLIRDPFPPHGEAPFHLILCRNVLIYFDSRTVARVVASLDHALAPRGTLVLGVADVLCRSTSRLAASAHSGSRPPRAPSRSPRPPLGRLPEAAVELTPWDDVMAHTSRLLAEDPLDAEAHFHRGVALLERGDPSAAVASLRRALYVDVDFGLAALTLGSAHEALGARTPARRAYERALRTLKSGGRDQRLLGEIDLRLATAAARERLEDLSRTPADRAPGRPLA